jgi:hypothetical protein
MTTAASREKTMIAPAYLALAFGSQLLITVADGVPPFDVAPSCRAAATVMPASFEACMKDEQDARAKLVSQWDGFTSSERASCTQNETVGGTPSYVELLSCLQMARDARNLPENRTDGPNR